MTISVSTNEQILLGNGVTTAFDFTFIMGASSNAKIYYVDTAGTQTLLIPSQYTLALNPPAVGRIWGVGGTVTYSLSGTPIPAGAYLIVTRIVPLTQTVSISNQGDFFPKAVEIALDNLEMQIQQVSSSVTGEVPPDLSAYYVSSGANTSTLGNFYGNFLASSAAATSIYCPTVGGTGDAITLTPTTPVASYSIPLTVSWIVTTPNTGVTTVNVSGLGAEIIKKRVTKDLEQGDLPLGAFVTATWDGTNFQLVNLVNPNTLYDQYGNPAVITTGASAAVNQLTIASSITGASPSISVTGADTNISKAEYVKGTGAFLDANITDGSGINLARQLINTGTGETYYDALTNNNNVNLLGGQFRSFSKDSAAATQLLSAFAGILRNNTAGAVSSTAILYSLLAGAVRTGLEVGNNGTGAFTYVVNGTPMNGNVGTTGYIKIPIGGLFINNIIIQYGITSSIAANTTSTVTLPVTYPNANIGVIITSTTNGTAGSPPAVTTKTASNFNLFNTITSTSAAYYYISVGY